MRNRFAICCLILALPAALAPAFAAGPVQRRLEQAAPADKPENRLDTLFAELKRERNEKAAERIAGADLGRVVQVRQRLDRSDDAVVAERDGAAEIRRRARFPRPGGHALARPMPRAGTVAPRCIS